MVEHEEHVRKTLVIIGDDDQCIYEWMGSEPQELARVKDAYRLPLYTLSTNYRCPANVLSAAAKCISNNKHSIPKAMNAHKPDGVLRYDRIRGGGLAAESRFVAESIAKQLDSGVAPSSISVLARNGAHLSLVWLYLSCYGIKSRVHGGSSGPATIVKHICDCFKLYTNMVDAGNVLYALVGGNKQSSDKLASLINMVDGTFLEWLEYVVGTYVPRYNIVLSETNAYGAAGKMWKEAMREYYNSGGLSKKTNSMENIVKLYRAGSISANAFYLEVIDIYKNMMEWKYKSDDFMRIFSGTVTAMKDLISKHAEQALPILTSLDKHKAPNKNYVTLSTAHSAKGREWNTVYIVCDDEYAFPSQLSIDILSGMDDTRAVRNFIEAERRLHYVAMTRARETLHIVGGDVAPGRFLCEALSDDMLQKGFDSSIGVEATVDFQVSPVKTNSFEDEIKRKAAEQRAKQNEEDDKFFKTLMESDEYEVKKAPSINDLDI